MIGILVVAHGNLGESLIDCVTHVMGKRPPQLHSIAIGSDRDPSEFVPAAQSLIKDLDSGEGVIVLSDIYGASPCNMVLKLLSPGRIEGVAGVNLPMLVRVLNYRDETMKKCYEKAVSGGRDGVVHFTKLGCEHNDQKK
jgi:mannose PTS system EIIA component